MGIWIYIRNHIRQKDWEHVLDTAEEFAKSLHALTALTIDSISMHEEELINAMAHANRLCERLDKAGSTGLPESETIKTLAVMRDNGLLLTSIRIALERSTIRE